MSKAKVKKNYTKKDRAVFKNVIEALKREIQVLNIHRQVTNGTLNKIHSSIEYKVDRIKSYEKMLNPRKK